MSKHNETLAEIVEEMRGMGNYQRYSGDHAHALADRIEAAWKRQEQCYLDQIRDAVNQWGHEKYKAEHAPIGDSAAIRESVENLIRVGVFPDNGVFAVCPPTIHGRGYSPDNEWCAKCKSPIKRKCEAWYKAKAALAAPPRNCDVGTAEEQVERMGAFCSRCGKDADGAYRCENCNLLRMDRCELAWAQMPYEKGEADGSR